MTSVAAEAPSTSFREVWLISAGHMMTHWYPATFYLLLPLIGRELGLSFGQIGVDPDAASSPPARSPTFPAAWLVDAIGRKGLLMAVALSWIGLPYLVMGFSHGYWMLLVCAALVGIGNNLWHPTAIPLLARRFSAAARAGGLDPCHGRQSGRRHRAARGRLDARRCSAGATWW